MLAGPIFRYELVAAGRRPRYFLVRAAYGCILLFTLWTAYESVRQSSFYYVRNLSIQESARIAKGIFYSFSWVQLLGVIAVTPALATGTIATERERRTIEYLFATDLSNAEIILGKIVARLLLAAKFAAVGLPILLLIRLLGGVPANAVSAMFVLSASTALLLTALSTCVSVWSKRARDAAIRVYLILGALFLLPPILWGLGMAAFGGQAPWLMNVVQWMSQLNPIWALAQALSFGGADLDMSEVWRVAGWHAALGVGFTALAIAAVRRVHLREAGSSGAVAGMANKMQKLRSFGWRPQMGDRPMVWKEAFAGQARTRLGLVGTIAAALIGVTVIGLTLFAFAEATNWGSRRVWSPDASQTARAYAGYLVGLSGVLGSALLLLTAARAAGLITTEKERDCWLSLLATPLTGRDVLLGKLAGNLYSLKWGVGLLGGAWLLGVLLDPLMLIAGGATLLSFLVCAAFLTMVGLYFSLRSKTTLRATGATLATALFIGGGYFFCCCLPVMIGGSGPGDGMILGFSPCMPFLMAAPGIFYVEAQRSYSSEESMALMAYLVGTAGYAIATAMLFAHLTAEFEKWAGRNRGRPDEPLPTLGYVETSA